MSLFSGHLQEWWEEERLGSLRTQQHCHPGLFAAITCTSWSLLRPLHQLVILQAFPALHSHLPFAHSYPSPFPAPLGAHLPFQVHIKLCLQQPLAPLSLFRTCSLILPLAPSMCYLSCTFLLRALGSTTFASQWLSEITFLLKWLRKTETLWIAFIQLICGALTFIAFGLF